MQKLLNFSEKTGLTLLVPIIKIAMKDEPKKQVIELFKLILLPSIALIIFFSLWSVASTKIKTSVGALPSPSYVWSQAKAMAADARAEKVNKAEFKFYEKSRATLSSMLTERRDLEAAAKSTETSDSQRAAFISGIQKQVNEQAAAIATLTAEVEKANTEAAEANITDRRIEPYKTSVLKYYEDANSSLVSLISKNTKIDAAIEALASGDEKKRKTAEKKRTAYEKQLSKPREYRERLT